MITPAITPPTINTGSFEFNPALQSKSKAGQRYGNFKKKYRDDRAAFVLDCIDWRKDRDEEPTSYQLEILSNFTAHPRQSVRGPHGLGKTALAAWVILHFALTRDGEDWKLPTTASSWRQLTKYLWPEIHKWTRRLRWDIIGRPPFVQGQELLTLSLKLETGAAFAVASNDPSTIEGAHADQIAYVFDESKSIIDETFDAAEGAFSGAGGDTHHEAYALTISTPGEPTGRFYDIQTRKPGYEEWHVRRVKKEEAIEAGRISAEWVERRRSQWGPRSAVYLNRVEGDFAASDEDSVIPLAWIEAANDRWHEWEAEGFPGEIDGIGVDVGISSDPTIIALSSRYKVRSLEEHTKPDPNTATMVIAGQVRAKLNIYPEAEAAVDVIGIGAGVVHRLNEQDEQDEIERRVHGFNAAAGTKRTDRTEAFLFLNMRAAAWWFMRELLDPTNEFDIALPPDDKLTGELTTPKYKIMSGAKIKIESKEDIKVRLKRSTDRADAVIQILTGLELCKKIRRRIRIGAA